MGGDGGDSSGASTPGGFSHAHAVMDRNTAIAHQNLYPDLPRESRNPGLTGRGRWSIDRSMKS